MEPSSLGGILSNMVASIGERRESRQKVEEASGDDSSIREGVLPSHSRSSQGFGGTG